MPNLNGMFDTLGNVWEGCWDLLDPARYRDYRVFRGGGFTDDAWSVRAASAKGDEQMKHMLIMRTTPEAVAAYESVDFEEVINAMGAYNESMMKAGVMVAGDGLAPEAGYVVEFTDDGGPIVSDGPYGEVHELFNGFWILQTATAEEAIEWAKRCPLGPWNKLEGPRIVASLARLTGDLGQAEDLAQEALAEALVSWERSGIPDNTGAWLTACAKRRAIDSWRRRERLDGHYRPLAHELSETSVDVWEPIDDDILRLVFTACHPALSRESQVALTLRVVGGLTTTEVARMLLVPVATVQARITRAKKTLAAARVPFETPEPSEWPARLTGVMSVVYLIFTEGYAATSGERWMRADLADEALRLGRVLSGLLPREAEAHGLLALLELQRSRFAARESGAGEPVLLADQNRARWDRAQIARGRAALRRSDAVAAARGRGRGAYALQAAIAECHSVAASVDDTDWERIVVLYEALGRVAPSAVVELNRAVAVSMATGPATALRLVEEIEESGALRGSSLLPSVRGELLARLSRPQEARAEFARAASLTLNEAQRRVIERKAAALAE